MCSVFGSPAGLFVPPLFNDIYCQYIYIYISYIHIIYMRGRRQEDGFTFWQFLATDRWGAL